MTGDPLVSCIMPTRNRRAFVGQAVWYFLRQDYPHRELIVLDDGDDPAGDLIPADERIRYVRLAERATVGAKRNLGCRLARGELIAHWDDDDWLGPRRLTAQVRELESAGGELCGAQALLHYRLTAGDAWLYRPKANGRAWLAGGTLVYRRALWERQPFADVDLGEDADFARRAAGEGIRALCDPPFYVAVVHRGNLTGHQVGAGAPWEPRSFDEVAARLSLDLEFYASLRNGGPGPAAPAAERISVNLASVFLPWDGYGLMAEYLALGMARSGAQVDVVALALDEQGLSREFRHLLEASHPDPAAPTVWFAPPPGVLERFPRASDLFINTMWESDELPPAWLEALCRARAVFVPSRFVARLCRRAGVTAPVEVIAEGVDPDLYPYVERPQRPGLTTLMVGPLVRRKHFAEAVEGWKRAFHDDPDARLILKGKHGIGGFHDDDPRIEVVVGTEPARGILHWYRRADVLLALGNEGFGLPLVEAMSTGLPVVALSSEGQSDMCEDAGDLVLAVPPAGWEPCNDTYVGNVGRRGVPSVDHVAARLRWVAEHRDEAADLGRAGSAWVRRHRNVWDKAPALLDAMERHMARLRPLRRSRTVWAPKGAPALHAYAASLLERLPGARLTSERPAPASLRLLHVQHDGRNPGELDLTEAVLQVRLAGVPTAVTEHAVAAEAHPWERDAAALVATTEEGAATLSARWPGKHVEHIPPGCPEWFPPRKLSRERVVAVLDPAAAPAVLAALRRGGGGELLLVTAAPTRPTRRVRQVAPPATAEQLAQLLAAEADVVVLPEAPRPDTARTVLASGVPALVPPSPAVADLVDATCQPDDLEAGLAGLLSDAALASELAERARQFCHEHSWARIAQRHLELWAALEAV
jgi:glycosyltransferase involved in cell wall biosynthesis